MYTVILEFYDPAGERPCMKVQRFTTEARAETWANAQAIALDADGMIVEVWRIEDRDEVVVKRQEYPL